MGIISSTVSGGLCKSWDVTGINRPDKQFPEFHYEHNFCRNPADVLNEPYCQRQSDDQYEKCDVPMCGKVWKA